MDKRIQAKCVRMLSCIIQNQIVMMEVMETQIETYQHTARYGLDYVRKLQDRIDISKKKQVEL